MAGVGQGGNPPACRAGEEVRSCGLVMAKVIINFGPGHSGKKKHRKPRKGLWLLSTGPDEPIKKDPMVVNLKPIKPGFRRPFTLTTDEPVDLRADGVNYFTATPTTGDSTIVFTSQTATGAAGFVNGDGAIGDKVVQISADAHVGEGDVEITLDVAYTVQNPDATEIGFTLGGPDEPIPTNPAP
jgi:hypothetical protein